MEKISEKINAVVANDGKALKELLNGHYKPGTLQHVGNFEFAAQTPDGRKMAILTEPADLNDEEYREIRIKAIHLR